MFLFTHGTAQYSAEARHKLVDIARTVFTCVAHPEQSVTIHHYLTYGWPVSDISVDNSENTFNVTLSDGDGSFWHEFYSFGEIESLFRGEDEEECLHYTSSDSLFKNDKTYPRDDESVCCSNDPVNHPSHYKTSSGLEAIDVIDAFTEDLKGYESVYTSQVLKYTLRWKHKNGLEDLEKANWYLTRLINKLKEAQK